MTKQGRNPPEIFYTKGMITNKNSRIYGYLSWISKYDTLLLPIVYRMFGDKFFFLNILGVVN